MAESQSRDKDYSGRPVRCKIRFMIYHSQGSKGIAPHDAIMWWYNAGPGLCSFNQGGGCEPYFEDTIKKTVEDTVRFLKLYSGREVQVSHTISDLRRGGT
jgi:hypothetical protein